MCQRNEQGRDENATHHLVPSITRVGFHALHDCMDSLFANLASMGEFDTKTFDAGNITISVRHVY